MAATTIAAAKLVLNTGLVNTKRALISAAALTPTGTTYVVSSTGNGLGEMSQLIFFIVGSTGNNTAPSTAGLTFTAHAATKGAKVYPTLAHQGDKALTLNSTFPIGSTSLYQIAGPFESARFLSTRGGKLGFCFNIKASSANGAMTLLPVLLPGGYSTYG
jgi:hypothetical protein